MTFAALSADMDAILVDQIGDDVTYTPDGQGALSLKAFVDRRAVVEDFGRTRQEINAPEVHIRVIDLPQEPSREDRIDIPGLGIFAVQEWPKDASGAWYIFDLNEVAD